MLLLYCDFGSQWNYELAMVHGVNLLSLVCRGIPGTRKSVLESCGIPIASFMKDSEGQSSTRSFGQTATSSFRDAWVGRVFTAMFCRVARSCFA
jgi:hypothetical protein